MKIKMFAITLMMVLVISTTVFALTQTKYWVNEDLVTSYPVGYVKITDGTTDLKLAINIGGLATKHFINVDVDETGFSSIGFGSAIGDTVNLTITNTASIDILLRETKSNTFINLPVGSSYNTLVLINEKIYENYWASGVPKFSVSFFKEYFLKIEQSGVPIGYLQNCSPRLISCKPNELYPIMPNHLGRYQSVLYLKNIPVGTYSNVRVHLDSVLAGRDKYSTPFTFKIVAPPVCSDGIDNDGDGKTDYPADNGCSSPSDFDEAYNCVRTFNGKRWVRMC